MQVTFENLDNINVVAHISIPASDVNPIYNNVVAKYKQGGSVPGFRKGKCPEKIILAKYAISIADEASRQLIDSSLKQALNEDGFAKCISRPVVSKVSEINRDCDFNYDVKFEIFPEYQAKPLSEIEVEKTTFEVTDAEVDEMINVLRTQSESHVEVEGDVAVNDQQVVNVSFVGSIDGEKFEGGSIENHRVDMRKPESMIPGFVEQIKGHKIGETFNIEATFPEDYFKEDLRGKVAVFETTINKIFDCVKPTDEEFCKKFNTESIDACKKALRINMSREGKAYCSRANWHAVTVAVGQANSEFELPPSLIESTKQSMADSQIERFRSVLSSGSKADDKGLENKLKEIRKDILESIPEDAAKEKALQNHFLREYIVNEKLNDVITPEAVEKASEEFIKLEASAYDESDEYIAELRNNKASMDRVHTVVENQMLLDALFNNMKTTVKALSFEEISYGMQLESMRNQFF